MTLKIQGQLEYDPERGVIYFHANGRGITTLRICRLPKRSIDTAIGDGLIDITLDENTKISFGR